MLTRRTRTGTISLGIACLGIVCLEIAGAGASAARGEPALNLLANGSFETGRQPWQLDRAGQTEARFALEERDMPAGRTCARVTIGRVEQWGVQFGQCIEQVERGKTYTFAALARSIGEPATVRLEVERRGKPYDRAGATEPTLLSADRWTELHVTFKVEKAFPEGWFAYLSCHQPGTQFSADAFRLYQGEYVAYQQAASQEAAVAAVHLLDTVGPSSTPLTPEALARRPHWTELPEDETGHAFQGDAVLMNDRLALVFRRGAFGAELYARGPEEFRLRAVLAPAGGPAKIARVSVLENGPSEAGVEAVYEPSDGRTQAIRYELTMGQPFVKTEARQSTKALALIAPCRYLVLPDFFADDIVIDAALVRAASAEIPCENFLLHLLPGGKSLLMAVATARDEDARIGLSGDRARQVDRSEIPYGAKGRIWVAALEQPGVWHEQAVTRADAGKTLALDWRAPYPAQWRVDWHQSDGLTGSWEMIVSRNDGEFEKYGIFDSPGSVPADRKRWNTVLGSYPYPCWIDARGGGHLQPLARKVVQFEGPAIVYPAGRTRQTPLDRFTIVDLVRGTLGVGPCEYILDLEGQSAAMRGRATCATRDSLGAIYAAGQQKQRRDEIEKILGEVVVFVKHIRGRIELYQTFGRDLADYLRQERRDRPELTSFIDRMEALTHVIHDNYQRRRESIRTPQYVVDLTEKFRREVLDDEGDGALRRCRTITEAIVVVGGNQDELVGECRMAVKVIRQQAALSLTEDPRVAPLAREIRRRTQQILRNPTSYEAPRH